MKRRDFLKLIGAAPPMSQRVKTTDLQRDSDDFLTR